MPWLDRLQTKRTARTERMPLVKMVTLGSSTHHLLIPPVSSHRRPSSQLLPQQIVVQDFRKSDIGNLFSGNSWRSEVCRSRGTGRISCYADETGKKSGVDGSSSGSSIQLYGQIERLMTETAKQSQDGWAFTGDWSEVEGAWVLKPKNTKPTAVVHFIGGVFVGAAPQLSYRLFLERLSEKGILVIATPFASGFDHFLIADEVQFKLDRCLRFLQDNVNDLPMFGIGHSLGSVIHLLIGSRYAVQRSGNILMSFNNKEASSTIPLFSPVIVPMAQNFGPLLSQLTSSSTMRLAEIAMKQLENISPPIMRQVLPLVEQLAPLYMDLSKGREDFTPKPEETRRLIKSYYGVHRNLLIKFKDDTIDETPTLAQVLSSEAAISSQLDMSIRSLPGDHGLPLQQIKSYYGVHRNLLIKFKDDTIDETPTLAQVLSSEAAISSQLDMSIRSLPGDHGLPLQQVLPDVPPAMADAVNRGSELFANLAAGTPWESMAKEVGSTLGTDSRILRAQISKDVDVLVDIITSWMVSNSTPGLLPPQ